MMAASLRVLVALLLCAAAHGRPSMGIRALDLASGPARARGGFSGNTSKETATCNGRAFDASVGCTGTYQDTFGFIDVQADFNITYTEAIECMGSFNSNFTSGGPLRPDGNGDHWCDGSYQHWALGVLADHQSTDATYTKYRCFGDFQKTIHEYKGDSKELEVMYTSQECNHAEHFFIVALEDTPGADTDAMKAEMERMVEELHDKASIPSPPTGSILDVDIVDVKTPPFMHSALFKAPSSHPSLDKSRCQKSVTCNGMDAEHDFHAPCNGEFYSVKNCMSNGDMHGHETICQGKWRPGPHFASCEGTYSKALTESDGVYKFTVEDLSICDGTMTASWKDKFNSFRMCHGTSREYDEYEAYGSGAGSHGGPDSSVAIGVVSVT